LKARFHKGVKNKNQCSASAETGFRVVRAPKNGSASIAS